MKLTAGICTKIFEDLPYQNLILREFNGISLASRNWGLLQLDGFLWSHLRDDFSFCPGNIIWHENDLPDDIKDRDEAIKYLVKSITDYLEKYPNTTHVYVVNEGFTCNGLRPINYQKVIGDDYILIAFEVAKKYITKYNRNVKLLINEFRVKEPLRMAHLFSYCQRLKKRGLLDGVGFQMQFNMFPHPPVDIIKKNLENFRIFGDIYFSEVSVWCWQQPKPLTPKVIEILMNKLKLDLNPEKTLRWEIQVIYYKQLYQLALELGVKEFCLWSPTDRYTWNWVKSNKNNCEPGIFDKELNPKPAYYAFAQNAN